MGQNLFLILYFGVGVIGIMPLQIYGFPIISTIYASFLIVMFLFVLRKHLCTCCYYYGKRCNTGWSKLASLMFKKESGNYELGVKLALITWMLATLVPIVGIAGALIFNYSLRNLIFLVLFVLLTPVNLLSHKLACAKCKMRFICPASMAK